MNKQSLKSWVIAMVVIGLVAVVYYGYFATPTGDAGLLQAQPEGELVGAQVLSLLNQIQSLKIDTSLFRSAAYLSLVDYTVAIPDQNVGRPNPFAPIPGFTLSSGQTNGRR